jgi:hypothetical protein
MELTGTIVKIKETESIPSKIEGGKDFLKREVWLEVPDDKFPQTINLELHGEKVLLIDGYAEGQEISVEINVKGKISGDKCWNTLQIWRVSEVKK